MRSYLTSFVATIAAIVLFPINSASNILTGEYSITASATQIGPSSYSFLYDVTNNNQQVGDTATGLAGFYIQVPESASISNITVPPAYFGGHGFWTFDFRSTPTATRPGSALEVLNAPEAPLKSGYKWLLWWGNHPASVYPIGTTAEFSFQADGVSLGTSPAVQVTYWNGYTPPVNSEYVAFNGRYYSAYSATLISPVVPEPSSIVLVCSALGGVAALRKRKIRCEYGWL